MRVLPNSLKEPLKDYIGNLVDEQKLIKLLRKESCIVSVGELVTYTCLKQGINPALCIVDFILERKAYSSEMKEKIVSYGKQILRVRNPSGCISDELWDAIQSAYTMIEKGEGPVRIVVDGEEDLASLAAIFLAPSGVTVIYGLPNKGVVVVKATRKHKKIVKDVLDKMNNAK